MNFALSLTFNTKFEADCFNDEISRLFVKIPLRIVKLWTSTINDRKIDGDTVKVITFATKTFDLKLNYLLINFKLNQLLAIVFFKNKVTILAPT